MFVRLALLGFSLLAGTCGGDDRPAAPAHVRLSAGHEHLCIVTTNGTPLCSGLNLDGQLGDGTARDHFYFVQPSGLRRVDAIAAGAHHTCALARGEVWCWGRNDHGQLGVGDTTPRFVPTKVRGLSRVASIDVGDDFSCARTADGKVTCWGSAEAGRLGREATEDAVSPAIVPLVEGATDLALGRGHACALVPGGRVTCWGDGRKGQVGEREARIRARATPVEGLERRTALAAGGDTTCTIGEGHVHCFGSSERGQLGDGSVGTFNGLPGEVPGIDAAVEVTVGTHHVCVRMADRSARCWGEGRQGELGRGAYESFPRPIAFQPLREADTIAAGQGYTCAVRRLRVLACAGTSEHGVFGNGANRRHPTAVDLVENLDDPVRDATFPPPATTGDRSARPRALAMGEAHVCASNTDGSLRCIGRGRSGRLGNGSTIDPPDAVDVATLDDVVSLAAFDTATCAVRSASVACFGRSDYGLGLPNVFTSSLPVQIAPYGGATVARIGPRHGCLLGADRRVRCWGENGFGQLGTGGTLASYEPTEVAGIDDARDVAVAETSTCVVRADGSVACFGLGAKGELGARRTSGTPVMVDGIANLAAITAHGTTYCGVGTDGHVVCWGDVEQFGVQGLSPGRPVPGLEGVVAVHLGAGFGLVRTQDGQVRCLGGANTTVCRQPPTFDAGDPPESIVTSADAACVLLRSGALACWGGRLVAEHVLRRGEEPVLVPTRVPGW